MVGYTFYFHENGARPETPAGEADAVKKVVEDTLLRGLIQNNSKEQVLAGISPGCDVSQYEPERDLVTKVKLPSRLQGLPWERRSAGRPISPSATWRNIQAEMPAAWRAVGQNGKVKRWQVYADWTEGTRTIAEDNAVG